MTATVLDVTTLTGIGIEQRAEAVAGGGGGGAITQGLRKKLLPTLKSTRRDGDRLAEGRENAF